MRNRRSIRLPNYDYTQPNAYFVTICTAQRVCLFGEICDGTMRNNAIGDLIGQTWQILPQRFPHVTLDEFVVMPNHVHGIICIEHGTNRRDAACCAPNEIGTIRGQGAASSAPTAAQSNIVSPSLADIVRAFKSISAIAANRLLQRQGQALWQRNYYERIIRNDDEWNRIREYIINNPAQWDEDDENPLHNTADNLRL